MPIIVVIRRFADFLVKEDILAPQIDRKIRQDVEAELKEAISFAEESPFPEPEEALEDFKGQHKDDSDIQDSLLELEENPLGGDLSGDPFYLTRSASCS